MAGVEDTGLLAYIEILCINICSDWGSSLIGEEYLGWVVILWISSKNLTSPQASLDDKILIHPNISLPRNTLQLLMGDTKPFPDQMGYI